MRLKQLRKEVSVNVLMGIRGKIYTGPYYIHAHDEINGHPEMIRLAGIWFQCWECTKDEIEA